MITKQVKTTTEVRYFISGLPLGLKEMARTIRGPWMLESYHCRLNLNFREEADQAIYKAAAYNLNIIKK